MSRPKDQISSPATIKAIGGARKLGIIGEFNPIKDAIWTTLITRLARLDGSGLFKNETNLAANMNKYLGAPRSKITGPVMPAIHTLSAKLYVQSF